MAGKSGKKTNHFRNRAVAKFAIVRFFKPGLLLDSYFKDVAFGMLPNLVRSDMASIQGPVRNQDILSFWNRHRFQIYKLCSHKMRGICPIQDLMQNVYIRLHTHFEEVRALENPAGWLMRVAENICHDEFRRLYRTQNVCSKFFRYDANLSDKESQRMENERQVNSFLDLLSPNLGTLVELHYLKGFSIDELSEISGIRRSTVAKRLVVSVGKMRKKVLDRVKPS